MGVPRGQPQLELATSLPCAGPSIHLDQDRVAFGSFLLIPERQLLLHRETPVKIGGRALDLLTALVERAGELVTKKELVARAWPTTVVEKSNLKVNVGALQRALEAHSAATKYIATVPGRGYRFIMPVETDVRSP